MIITTESLKNEKDSNSKAKITALGAACNLGEHPRLLNFNPIQVLDRQFLDKDDLGQPWA